MPALTHRPLLTAALTGILACGGGERAPETAGSADSAAAPAAGAAITLPAGFRSTVFADSLGQARQMSVRANGDVYVNTHRSPYDTARKVPAGGFIVALRDTNQDGKADLIQRFGDGRERRHRDRHLQGRPLRGERRRHRPVSARRERAGADWEAGHHRHRAADRQGHTSHPFTIDADGNLYVNSGSATNACQEKDRQAGSVGPATLPGAGHARRRLAVQRHQAGAEAQRRGPVRHRNPQHRRAGDQPGRRRPVRRPARARPAGGELAQAVRLEAECGAAVGGADSAGPGR